MKTINIIGDSHTGALGPRLKVLLEPNDVDWDSFPGFSTARVLSELNARPPRPADLTVIILGGNDFGNQASARVALVRFLRANKGGKLLWVGPAFAADEDVDVRHHAQAMAQAAQMPSLNVPWMSSAPATPTGHGRDGVHFTKAGYDTWAAAIATRIESELRNRFVLFALWAGVVGIAGAIVHKTLRLGRR